jgi:hypothetical protein
LLVDGWTPKTGACPQPAAATFAAVDALLPNVPTNQSATGGCGPAAISARMTGRTSSPNVVINATGFDPFATIRRG